MGTMGGTRRLSSCRHNGALGLTTVNELSVRTFQTEQNAPVHVYRQTDVTLGGGSVLSWGSHPSGSGRILSGGGVGPGRGEG